MEDELSSWSCRIDSFSKANKLDIALFETLE